MPREGYELAPVTWSYVAGLLLAFLAVLLVAIGVQAATIHVPTDASTVQSAIDQAGAGDTIHVAAGTYDESVEVNKRLVIEGEGAGVTVLRLVDQYVIKVTEHRTSIANMTIIGNDAGHGIWLSASNYHEVVDVDFERCVRGLFMENVDDSRVINCTFSDSTMGVWMQRYADKNEFLWCEFTDCFIGLSISTGGFPSRDNEFRGCRYEGNTYLAVSMEGEVDGTTFTGCLLQGNEAGLDLDESLDTTIIGCTIASNNGNGVKLDDGQDLLVQDCVISSNAWSGVNVTSSSSVEVRASTFELNEVGISLTRATTDALIDLVVFEGTRSSVIVLSGCSDVNITRCALNGSRSSNGISISGSSLRVRVSGCSFNRISNLGMAILGGGNVTVELCSFTENGDGGIRTWSSSDLTVRSCTFEHCDYSGMILGGNSVLVEDVESHNSSFGIHLSYGRGVVVRSSDFSWNQVGLWAGGSVDVDVSSTVVTGCMDGGIMLSQCTGVSVSSCLLRNDLVGMFLSRCRDVVMSDLVIDGNENGGIRGEASNGLRLVDTVISNTTWDNGLELEDLEDGLVLSRCTFRDSGRWGAIVSSSPISRGRDVHVDNCTFSGNEWGCMLAMADDSSVRDSIFVDNVDQGMDCRGMDNLTVSDCTMSGNDVGAFLFGNEATDFSRCTVVDNRMDGVNISGTSLYSGVRLHNNTIRGNGLSWGDGAGVILYEYGSGNLVEDNLLDGNAVGVRIAWRWPTGRDNIVRGNLITNSTVCGLVEDGPVKPNLIHLNAFVANAAQVLSPDDNERFDDGELGNYWDDYRERYPDAKRVGRTWDTPYEVEPGSGVLDYHPLSYWSDAGPPVADAGADLTVGYGEQFTLDGSGSRDDTGISSYHWSVDMGDGTVLEFPTASASPRIYRLGTFVATLTVTDVWGNTATDTVTVTVVDDEPPLADAGEDVTVGMGRSFQLDGSGSWDNVRVVSHDWSIVVDGNPLQRSIEVWTLSIEAPGTYTATLTVTDVAGNTDTDTVNVTVTDTERPHAVAGDSLRVDQGAELTFDGSTSWDNVGITSHTWYLRVGTRDVTWEGAVFTHTFPDPGRFTLRLVVHDAAGNYDEDRLVVDVRDTEDPTAAAGEDLVVDQGEDFVLDGSGSVDNVGVTGWTWTYDPGDGVVEVANTRTVVSLGTVGVYEFVLTVVDDAGNSASDTLTVRVRDSTPPVADAGEDRTVDEGSTVRLDATGSSDNVGVEVYRWTFQYGGREVELDGPEARFDFDRPGTYAVTLTVADAEGNWATDTMTVEVTSVDVSWEPRSYLLLVVVIVVVVLLVLWRLRPREDGGARGA